ncbi:MAG: thioredoxin family protein [Thermoanaerobaculia bacterium]
MTLKTLLLALSSVVVFTALTGAADPPAASLTAKPAAPEEPVPVGPTTREKVEASPEWVQAEVDAKPDAGAAQALAAVEPGAEVTVFLGTWCGDSRREVPRFWKALDAEGGVVPFQVRYVGVDHDKKQPADLLKESDVRYLPTFIVRRGGREVGRIVETSPHGVEQDLLALLTGKASGVLTTRQDLAPANPHPQG